MVMYHMVPHLFDDDDYDYETLLLLSSNISCRLDWKVERSVKGMVHTCKGRGVGYQNESFSVMV